MRKITNKSREIYKATKSMCRRHIEDWGYDLEKDGGFNRVSTEECVSARVMNDMKALLKSDLKTLEIDLKLQIGTKEQRELEEKTLIMLEKTLNNQYVSGRKLEKY